MILKSLRFLVFLLWFLCITNAKSSAEGVKLKCKEGEKQALLKLKGGLKDYRNLLSSWGSKEEDCCKWNRVRCNKKSGHVDTLDLGPVIKIDTERKTFYGSSTSYKRFQPGNSFSAFGGVINSSLLELQHLTYLDLSQFNGTFNPKLIASLERLTYLNLSGSHLSGAIPYHLGNLSRLVSLDLGQNNFQNVQSLMWISHLHALKHLDISNTSLRQARDWFQAINSLPLLVKLRLSRCGLSVPIHPSVSRINSSASLALIDLSYNSLSYSIFPWLFNFSNTLVDLRLFQNELQVRIPDAIGMMRSLKNLDLGSNQLLGEIPRALGNLSNLETLDMSYNSLSGDIPRFKHSSLLREVHIPFNKLNGSLTESVGLLSNLEVLNVYSNSMNGVISDVHFSNLTKLRQIFFSLNSFTFNFSSNWVPPFQLQSLAVGSCSLGPRFPQWLRMQKRLFALDMSNSSISDVIGSWFWELPFKLLLLKLNNNQISGDVHKLPLIMDDFSTVDLSSNLFHGSIPLLPPNITQLNLSKNMFSGTASNLCSITGQELTYLDLSHNFLSGKLPVCWTRWKALNIINLSNNNFAGSVPTSLGWLPQIETLHLRKNNFSGELPPTLRNCAKLKLLDVGENRFSGKIPEWIGQSLSSLIALRLRSNHFHGTIPLELCHLQFIQILDLSHNNISGNIPQCLSNFTAMARKGGVFEILYHNVSYPFNVGQYINIPYIDNLMVAWKGLELEYTTTLGLVKSLDLSSNTLNGEIPSEITSLFGLVSLNLSHNQLNGVIPLKIGQLRALQSLDLSVNQLVGGLPESLSELTYLSLLNLSYNNLSGKIPLSTQLQGFDNTSFLGNARLCGKPLPNVCPGDEAPYPYNNQGTNNVNGDGFIDRGFYVSMGLGFATGFWAICGTLLLNRFCRHFFFCFLDDIERWLYETVALNIAKLLTRH